MKRFHLHLTVTNLSESIRFYCALFGAEPTVTKSDYAKWMLDDPRVNFAISTRGPRPGVDHLGIQAESDDELHELHGRLERAEVPTAPQDECGVLLCTIEQALDGRSARHRVGVVPQSGYHPRLWGGRSPCRFADEDR